MDKKRFEIMTDLSEAVVDLDTNTIRNVVILSEQSKNGRVYTDECQSSAVANGKFENMQSFFNHEKTENRNVRDLIGKYVNVKFDEQSKKTVGDLKLIPNTTETEKMLSIAENMPDLLGNSISARGKYYRENDVDIITDIVDVYSGDIVSRPATTKGLFEDENNEETNKNKESEMEIKDVTLGLIREQKPSILKPLSEEIDNLKQEVKDLKEELDEYKTKEKLTKKKETINKMIKEAELPDELITDVFKEILISAKDEKIAELIEDRKKLLEVGDGVKNNHEKGNGEDSELSEDAVEEAIKGD